MIDLEPAIATIEQLIEEGSEPSLTYAALECRLAIERLCYDRLRVAHDYISSADLTRWQPRDIVNKLIKEVDPHASAEFTLSISRTPEQAQVIEPEVEDYERMEWVLIGTQSALDPDRIGKLWNALSSLALHARVPPTKEAPLPMYGDGELIRRKVLEALELIRTAAKGTLISSGLGETVSFDCYCGAINKRRVDLLAKGTKVSCINPKCLESYIYDRAARHFERRVFPVACDGCSKEYWIPFRNLENLKIGQELTVKCKICERKIRVAWQPMQAQSAS